MLGRLRRSGGRQFAAALLIFALMMQGMALAVAAGRLAAGAAPDSSWAGFEICHHGAAADDSGAAATPGSAPERSDSHCIFCLAGTGHAIEALLPGAAFHIIVQASEPWIFTAWRLPAFTVDASARPRGPPLSA